MKAFILVFAIAFFILLFEATEASHYKGGTVSSTWNENGTLSLRYQLYFRRNGTSPIIPCEQNDIQQGTFFNDTQKMLIYYCPPNYASKCDLKLTKNDYRFRCRSTLNDWSLVEHEELLNTSSFDSLKYNKIIFRSETTQTEWANPFKIQPAWVHMTRNVINRKNVTNTPPKIEAFPVLSMLNICNVTFKIRYNDTDGDIVRCRRSINSGFHGYRECGQKSSSSSNLCQTHSNIIVDSDACTLTFLAGKTNQSIVEIQVEDFDTSTSTEPMSSVPLQFSTVILNSFYRDAFKQIDTSLCSDFPEFTQTTLPDEACFPIDVGKAFSGVFEAFSALTNVSAFIVDYSSFEAFSFDRTLRYNPETKSMFNTYQIAPRTSFSLHTVTATAQNKNGLMSSPLVLNFLVGYSRAPKIVEISNLGPICNNESNQNTHELMFRANMQIRAPSKPNSRSTRILFFDRTNNQKVAEFDTKTISISSDTFSLLLNKSQFKRNVKHYILFTYGAFVNDEHCQVQSREMSDPKAFELEFVDDKATKFAFKTPIPSKTEYSNGKNVTIEWNIERGSKNACYMRKFALDASDIQTTQFNAIPCDENHLVLQDLETSTYQIFIIYATLCGTLTYSNIFEFKVVNQKPVVEYKIENGIKGFASANLRVAFTHKHPVPVDFTCQFWASNSNQPAGSPCNNGLFKPTQALTDAQNYSFELSVSDRIGNKANNVILHFTADLQPPSFITFPQNKILACGDESYQTEAPSIADFFDPMPTLLFKEIRRSSCLLEREWTAVDHVGNKLTKSQRVEFISKPTVNYDRITLACVTNKMLLNDLKFYKGYISLKNNLCNSTLQLELTNPKLPNRDCDFEFQAEWKISDDCGSQFDPIKQNVTALPRQLPYSPLHEQTNVDLSPTFMWPTRSDARSLELFLRGEGDESSRLLSSIASLTAISKYSLTEKLEQGKTYYWNAVYKLTNGTKILSPFWEFSVKRIADLELTEVKLPPTNVFPGKDIKISWRVRNIGNVTTTNNYWSDAVYGSEINNMNSLKELREVSQRRYLEPKGEYWAEFTFSLPLRFKGNSYFVAVSVDKRQNVDDSNRENNKSPVPLQIAVDSLDLPNLQPRSMVFDLEKGQAGKPLEIVVIVENTGRADVLISDRWTDSIELSVLGGRAFYRSQLMQTGPLKIGASYVTKLDLLLPENYEGNVSVAYSANVDDRLYESDLGDNLIFKGLFVLTPFTPVLSILNLTLEPSEPSVYTGQNMRVSYWVSNDGMADTRVAWIDRITLKSTGNSKELFTRNEQLNTQVKAGESYERSVVLFLSHDIADGNYSVELSVDHLNAIYNPTLSGVRTMAKLVRIVRSKPTWKLNELTLNVRAVADGSTLLQINYALNISQQTEFVNDITWTDSYYLSDRSTFISATKLDSSTVNTLRVDGDLSGKKHIVYRGNTTIVVNGDLDALKEFYGDLYLYAFIDEESLNEKVAEYPVPIMRTFRIVRPLCTLNLTYFRVLKSDGVNKFSFEMKLKNLGPLRVVQPEFELLVAKAGANSAMFRITSFTPTPLINNGQEIWHNATQFTLDQSIFGKLNFFIRPRWSTAFKFIGFSENAVEIVQPISVDFKAISLTHTSELSSGSDLSTCDRTSLLVEVKYEVQNIGPSMTQVGTWTDKIDIVCGSGHILATKSVRQVNILSNKATYASNISFIVELPREKISEKCSIRFETNQDRGVFEALSTLNNKLDTCCVNVPVRPAAITAAQLLNKTLDRALYFNNSETLTIMYELTNTGNASVKLNDLWTDSLYLYASSQVNLTTLMTKGMWLASKKLTGLHVACNSNSDVLFINAYLPKSVSGEWYVYLVHRVESIKPSAALQKSTLLVNIREPEICDLAVLDPVLNSPKPGFNITGGTTLNVSFSVANVAESGAARGMWFDSVYLAKFPTPGPLDVRLMTRVRPRELEAAVNDSYALNFEIKLPLTLKPGDYFLVLIVDNERVTRDLNFDNNQNHLPIRVNALPVGDLFAYNLTMSLPNPVWLGFSWKLGAMQPAEGERCDTYYLSRDQTFDYASDLEIANGFCAAFVIRLLGDNVLSSVDVNRNVPLPPLITDGEYYGIARTISNIQEANYDNNAVASNQTIRIELPKLKIDVADPQVFDLSPNGHLLVKVVIDEPDIEAFRVTLSTDSTDALNDLYISNERAPSENNYVAKSKLAYSYNQTAVVRNARFSASYYVLVKSYLASSIASRRTYQVKLSALRVRPIEINSVYPIKLSLLGRNTLKLTGFFKGENLRICIAKSENNSSDARGHLVCAIKVHKLSFETLFGTFDLSELDLTAGELVRLSVNGVEFQDMDLEIIRGVPGVSKVQIKTSTNIYRPGQVVIAKATVFNLGDTDVNVPVAFMSTFNLNSEFTGPFTSFQQLYYKIVSIDGRPYASMPFDHLILNNNEGLGAVLQPRSSAIVKFQIEPVSVETLGNFEINLHVYKDNFFHEYLKEKIDNHRIDGLSDTDWQNLARKLIAESATQQGSDELLYETINEFSAHGVRVYRLDELINYHLLRLNNDLFQGALFESVDMQIVPNFLVFRRTYAASASSRATLSIMGYGWTDELNMKLSRDEFYNLVRLQVGGKQRRLRAVANKYNVPGYDTTDDSVLGRIVYSDGLYEVSYPNDTRRDPLAFVLWKTHAILMHYDLNTRCIQSINLPNGVEIEVKCNARGLISELNEKTTTTAPGFKVKFDYSFPSASVSLLVSIVKYSADSSREPQRVQYLYGSRNELKQVIAFGWSQTCSYDKFNLISIEDSEDVRIDIAYNSNNLVESIRSGKPKSDTEYALNRYEYLNYGPIRITDQVQNKSMLILYDVVGNIVYLDRDASAQTARTITSASSSEKIDVINDDKLLRRKYFASEVKVEYYSDQDRLLTAQSVLVNRTTNVREFTDANANRVRLISHASDDMQIRESEKIYPDNSREAVVIDRLSKEFTVTTRSGKKLSLKQDAQNRQISHSHATGDGERACTYSYSSASGQLRNARSSDPIDSIELVYEETRLGHDYVDLLVSVRSKEDFEVTYEYDKSNLIRSFGTNSGFGLTYKYDSDDRLESVSLSGSEVVEVNYLSESSFELINSLEDTYSIFEYDRSQGLLLKSETGTVQKTNDGKSTTRVAFRTLQYQYNKQGQLTKLLRTNSSQTCAHEFNYDTLGNMIYAFDNETDLSLEFRFDLNGNMRAYKRRQQGRTLESADFQINNMNQLLSNGIDKFDFNEDGNVRKATVGAATTAEFFYYDDGKLKEAFFESLNDTCVFVYDCLERLSMLKCNRTGTFTYNYNLAANFDALPISIALPNGTFINFIHLPVVGVVGMVVNNKVTYFSLSQHQSSLDDLISGTCGTNAKPLLPGVPIGNGFFLPIISSSFSVGTNHKPVLTQHCINLGTVPPISTDEYTSNQYLKPLVVVGINSVIQTFVQTLSGSGGSSVVISPGGGGIVRPPNPPGPTNPINPAQPSKPKPPYQPNPGQNPNLPRPPQIPNSNNNRPSSPYRPTSNKPNSVKNPCDSFTRQSARRSAFSNVKLAQETTLTNSSAFEPKILKVSDFCVAVVEGLYTYYETGGNAVSALNDFGQSLQGSMGLPSFPSISSLCDDDKSFNDKVVDNAIDKLVDHALDKLAAPASCAGRAAKAAAGRLLKNATKGAFGWLRASDPNDMLGPQGYEGDRLYISKHERFIFRIRFENMADAGAPAQVVRVVGKLSDKYELRRTRFLGYGFNNYASEDNLNNDDDFASLSTSSNQGRPYINDRIKLKLDQQEDEEASNNPVPLEVRVFASVELTQRELIWIFRTVDLSTGDVPEDASLGFLPPKQNGTKIGEGYVDFEVELVRSVANLDVLESYASIVFDDNEPIETNVIIYTLDDQAPELNLAYDQATQSILVNASDAFPGSGINEIVLTSSPNQQDSVLTSRSDELVFRYYLQPSPFPQLIYASAEDNVGNIVTPRVFFNITYDPDKLELGKECPNNCSSGQGKCSIFGICECFDMFTGADCNETKSVEDVLNEPVSFEFSVAKSLRIRDAVEVEFSFKKSYEQLTFSLANLPIQFEFIYENQSYSEMLEINLEETAKAENNEEDSIKFLIKFASGNASRSELNLKLKLIAQRIVAEDSLQTMSADNEISNETSTAIQVITWKVENQYDLTLEVERFLPQSIIDLDVNCFNQSVTENKLPLKLDQIQNDDKIEIERADSPSFLQFSLQRDVKKGNNVLVKALESFTDLDLSVRLVFKVTDSKNFSSVSIEKEFFYTYCKSESTSFTMASTESTTTLETTSFISNFTDDPQTAITTTADIDQTKPKPSTNNLGAILGGVFGGLAFVILVVVIYFCARRKGANSRSTNSNRKSRYTTFELDPVSKKDVSF